MTLTQQKDYNDIMIGLSDKARNNPQITDHGN